jgi:phosphatidylserine/phosphatidylglycerophosphate/cardiolipin synthase-like enzyme
MAKFLTTKQISSQLEELIQTADKTLYLVSPFLKLSEDFQELINSRNKNEKKTIIIYGKYELTPEQLKFLTGLRHVYLKFHKNLHAKCYLNDSKLIITSLNFYDYSMINNKEIGVLYDLNDPGDKEIYSKALEHIKFIEENSDDKPFELNSSNAIQGGKVEKPDESKQHKTPEVKKDKETKSTEYKVWSQFGDPDYPEKFCHFSGEPSNGETSVSKPILKKNWKKAKEIFNF